MADNSKYKRMTEEEKAEYEELYKYVKRLMGYGNNKCLPYQMELKLKGLKSGKYIENKNIPDKANYSYRIILTTFKAYANAIENAIRRGGFKDENHKINYILSIVKNHINDIVKQEERIQKANEKAESMTVATPVTDDNYVRKGKPLSDKQAKRLEHLW